MFKLQNLRLFEDDCLLVVDKPVDFTVNRSLTEKSATLQDLLDLYYDFRSKYKANSENEEFLSKSGILHRLDKQTSGILLVAKTPESYIHLKKQFLSRTIEKEYAVVVLGEIPEQNFQINAPIKRDPRNRLRMALSADGREAITDFTNVREIRVNDIALTYLIAYPRTGRTHQIRVHLAGLGKPIVGDAVYCTRKQFESTKDIVTRMMLHAKKLAFNHPRTNKRINFSSHLPKEFESLIKI